MAVSIANISIKLGASSATLRRDLQDGESALQRFAQNARRTATAAPIANAAGDVEKRIGQLNSIRNWAEGTTSRLLAVAAAAAVSTVAFGTLHSQLQLVDSTADLADSLNMSTEALQRFRYAATFAGSNAAAADEALMQMTARLGQVRAGGGTETAAALESIGLEARRLAEMNPAAAFAAIADGIRQLPTAADRAAAAMRIFGKQGKDLLPFLSLGSAGLAEMGAEADRAGVTFSRLDASRVQEANDAIDRMQFAFAGLAQVIVIQAAPAIANFADGVSTLVQSVSGIDAALGGNTIKLLEFVAGSVGAVFALQKIIQFASAAATALRGIALAAAAMGPVGWIGVAVGVAAAGAATYFLNDGVRETAAASDTATKSVKAQSAAIEEANAKMARMNEEARKAEQAQQRWASIGERIRDSVATPFEQAQAKLQELSGALDAGAISWETYERAIAKVADEFQRASTGSNSIREPKASVGAVTRDSTAGFSAVQSGRAELQRLEKQAVEQIRQTRETNRLLGVIDINTRASPIRVNQVRL